MQRQFLCLSLLVAVACQLPNEQPPASPGQPSNSVSNEPAPLPPEETPPPEEPTPTSTAEAKPIEPGVTSTSGAPKRGSLPKAVIDEKLKSAQPAIQGCYERALKARADLRGNVSINFVVAPEGKVAHAEAVEVEDALSDAATVDCILAEIRKLEFPAPSGGRVFLNYPLRLEPPPVPPASAAPPAPTPPGKK
ncbi:MAG TPA: AgmX/PglI C-terminal domain-containing protein [Polyangiaceae bacterium]|nr:AgmX/PglI C-terminal domain-containing protein [Polyangiaceae bacterium]